MLVRMRNKCCYGNTAGGVLLLKKTPTEMTSAAEERTVLSGLVEFLGEGITFSFILPNIKM